MNPLVSVFCLTYNHAAYIKDALDGFVGQRTDFPFEVLIHDDASTDDTAKIIRRYEAKFPHIIKPIYQKENQLSKGVKISKSILYPLCKSKYVALCEGDDYWTNANKLQMQVDYMEQNPDCSCTFHPAVWINKDGKVVGNDQHYFTEKDLTASDIIINSGAFIATASMVGRADIMKKWPKFRQIADVGDYPSAINLGLHGKFHYFPQIMSCYRTGHAGSWTGRFENDMEFRARHWIHHFKWMMELNRETDGAYFDEISARLTFALGDLMERGAVDKRPAFAAIIDEYLPTLMNIRNEKQELTKADETLKQQMIAAYDEMEKQAVKIQEKQRQLKAQEDKLKEMMFDKLAKYEGEPSN